MEGNCLTSGDLALFSEAKGHGLGCYGGYDHRLYRDATATTGVGLAAGLGGGALLLAIAAAWGVNQASKSRLKAAENACNGNSKAIDLLAQTHLAERQSRETWQNQHAPTMTQYVDVTTNAGAGAAANANALSLAQALAIAQNNTGINSAIGGCNFLRVARYSAPQACPCDNCNG